MSKRYCKEECLTTAKRKRPQRPLTSRQDTGSRVITESSEGHLLSMPQRATPESLRSSVQQPTLAKSGQSTTLIRSISVTDSKIKLAKDKLSTKKIGWETILDEVGFLKQKINQIERPTFGREDPKAARRSPIRNPILPLAATAEGKPQTQAAGVFGREYTLQSIHLLYEEIVYLRNENLLLKDNLRHAREELEYQRKESVKQARTLSILTSQNEKMRNEFLSQGRKLLQNKTTTVEPTSHNISQNSAAADTAKQPPASAKLPLRTRPTVSQPVPGVLTEITNRPQRQQTLSTYPSKHLMPAYSSQAQSENRHQKDSSEENLLEEVRPQSIERRLKQLNEKFEILLFNSKHEKGREARMTLKEELFAVTAEIKALQQQKTLLTCLH